MKVVDEAAIEARVTARVLASIIAALGGALETPWSTREGHEPPEFERRRKKWRATLPKIPGAVRIGRWWSIDRASYAAWLRSQATTPAPAASEPAWSPAQDLPRLKYAAVR